jgi:hypothetical protein
MANRFRAAVQSLGLAVIGVGAMLAGSNAALADQPQVQVSVPTSPQAGLRVIRSNEHGLLLELTVPDYTLNAGHLGVAGADRLANPGKPDLPKFSALIGIPAEATVSVQVVQDEAQVVMGPQSIAPVPSPVLPDGDLQPGKLSLVPDRAAYANRALYPAEVARVADMAWLRDQRLARLEIYPFQYRAATQALTWHRRLLIEVKFEGVMLPQQLNAPSTASSNNPFEGILQQQVLNYEVARQWRSTSAGRVSATQPAHSATSLAPRTKIVVNHDGVYRVTYADLQAAGLDMSTFDPRNLQLTNQGLDVAITVVGETDGHFDPGDYVLFYGQKLRGDLLASKWITESSHWLTYGNWIPHFNAFMVERYTDNNVYWLSVGSTPGLRMATSAGSPSGQASVPDYYTATVRLEQSTYWRTWTFTSEDVFFWDRVTGITNTVTRTYPITLTAVAAQNLSATVTGEVVAGVQNTAAAPDHRTQFYMNTMTQPFEDATWDGITRHRFVGTVPLAALSEGVNNLVFVARKQPALSSDEMLFDWFKIDYARRFQAEAGALTFQGDHSGAVQYDVSQLTSPTVTVLDVSNPWLPRQIISPQITTNGGGYTASFEVSQTVPLTYVVADQSAWQSPAAITRYAPTIDLRDPANGADYLVITHHDFITGAQALANYRATQGQRTKVVDLDDVYNQFTDGLFNPIAIKAFLKYAYFNWQSPAPAYVVLVGDGHWNFKGYVLKNPDALPGTAPNFMPPYMAWVDPWQGEVDSSSLLAAVAGDDIFPDMAIGRIPVNSAAEMNIVVSKTLAYEQAAPQDWQRRLMFVADNTPDPANAGDFVALSEQAINSYAPKPFAIDRIYENNFGCSSYPCPAVNYAITNTLNLTGALLVNYVGHGAIPRWSGESILYTPNASTLNNLGQLPIILSLTCLDGYWYYPHVLNNTALMETMLRAPNGGDVASFSPTGLGVANGHDVLQRGFYRAAFNDGAQRLGTAALAAKAELYATGYDLDLVSTFTVIGDPALVLPTYRLQVSPASAVQSGLPGTVVSYTLEVTNTGTLTHTGLVKITGNTWPVTVSPNLVVPLGQSQPVVVSTTIPLNSPLGAVDAMTVTFSSTDGVQQALVRLTTVPILYGVTASDQPAPRAIDPGASVTYTLAITNAGTLTDTFVLSSIGNTWPVSISPDNLADLPPGASAQFNAVVSAPVHALPGDTDVSQLVVASQGSLGVVKAAIYLTTTANTVYGFDLAPKIMWQLGMSGTDVTYTLSLTNTSNVTNSYAAEVGGTLWPITVSPANGLLAPWVGVTVPVRISIPEHVGAGVMDTATVTMTMSLGGLAPQRVSLITLANPYQVALPLVWKGN